MYKKADIKKVIELSTQACSDLTNIKALLEALFRLCELQNTDLSLIDLTSAIRKKIFDKIQKCKSLLQE